jgi:hypothetical protein
MRKAVSSRQDAVFPFGRSIKIFGLSIKAFKRIRWMKHGKCTPKMGSQRISDIACLKDSIFTVLRFDCYLFVSFTILLLMFPNKKAICDTNFKN